MLATPSCSLCSTAIHRLSSLYLSCNSPATTEIYTLSLHDALPISWNRGRSRAMALPSGSIAMRGTPRGQETSSRSEEHTSELQSHHDLVCRLLLEKKNT